MKNVVIILLILIAALGAFVYFTNPDLLKQPPATEPASSDRPVTTAPKPVGKSAPTPSKKAAKPATLKLPSGLGTIYVNGKPAGESLSLPAGPAVVAAYDGTSYAHTVVDLEAGKTLEARLEKTTTQTPRTWQTFQGGNTRKGHVRADRREQLAVKWSAELGQEVKSSPVLFGTTAYFAAESAQVIALDLTTGKVLWQQGVIGSSVTPIATDRFVFAGSDTGHFQAFRVKDGKPRGEIFLDSYATGLALVDETSFVVTTRANKVLNVQTRKNFMGRVPLKENWSTDLNELWKGASVPAIASGTAVFQTEEGLVAVNLESGQKQWPRNPGATGEEMQNQEGMTMEGGKMVLNVADASKFLFPTPVIDGQTVYGVTRDGVVAHALADGKQLWQSTSGSTISSSLSMAHGFIYYGTKDGHIEAVSSKSRKVVFRAELDGKPVFASPVLFADQVLVGAHGGTVHLLNAFTGAEIARADEARGKTMYATPAVGDDLILVINGAGKMVCFQ